MAAQAPAPFALYPGEANNGILDFNNAEHSKYFSRATKAVNGEYLYDCTPGNLFGFLRDVEAHDKKFGWAGESGIFYIPDNPLDPHGQATNFINLLTNYGEVSMDTVREWEEQYIGTECRATQDSVQCYHALRESLSQSALDKVNIHMSEYNVEGISSGPLFLKVIIRESVLDTNATALTIWSQLGSESLIEYLQLVLFVIVKFNQHVLKLLNALSARD